MFIIKLRIDWRADSRHASSEHYHTRTFAYQRGTVVAKYVASGLYMLADPVQCKSMCGFRLVADTLPLWDDTHAPA